MGLRTLLSAIAARHQAHWQADALYRRCWYFGPQVASMLVVAFTFNPFDVGAAPAAPWSTPVPGPAQTPKPAEGSQPPPDTKPVTPANKANVSAASDGDQQICSGNDVDNALRVCSRLIESLPRTDPWLANAYYFRARNRDGKQQTDLALKDLADALEVLPNAAGTLVYRGGIYFKMGKRELAIADYTAAARANPNWAQPLVNLADAHRANGNLDVALGKIGEAYRLAPADAWVLTVKTRITFDRKKWADAIADATSWIAVAPTASEAYYIRGAAKEELKDANAALADLAEGERLGYRTAGLFNYKGSAYEQLKNYDLAQVAYAASLQVNSQGIYPRNRRAQIAFDKHLMSDVEADTSAVLAIDPKNYSSLVLRLRMAYERSDFSWAVIEADRILVSRPNDTYAIHLRARAQLNAELGIIEPCKKFGHVTADRSRWSIGAGQDAKCREGPDIAGAIRELDRALEVSKKNADLEPSGVADLYATRANGYLWLGNRQQAELDLRAGLALNPNNTFIRQLMQRAGFKF